MKRRFSMALVLALLLTSVLSPALAEGEVVSGNVEAAVAEAGRSGEISLAAGDAVFTQGQAPEEAIEETSEEPAPYGYARIKAKSAVVTADARGRRALATVRKGSVVLTTGRQGKRTAVALYTERGVITGFIKTSALKNLTDEQIAAYLDGLASDTVFVLYQSSLDAPMAMTDCEFASDDVTGEGATPAGSDAEYVLDNTNQTNTDDGAGDQSQQKSATAIRLSASRLSIGVGEKFDGLAAIARPAGSALPEVTWRSGNKKYVTVNAGTGLITGVKKGTAYVYAKMKGSSTEVKCRVTVRAKPSKVTLSPAKGRLSVGMTAKLTATVPKGSAAGKLTFVSSKPAVASVDDDGNVVGLSAGSATITVSTYNGKTAKCAVKVVKAPAYVDFSDVTVSMAVGQTRALTAAAKTAAGADTPANISYSVDPASPNPNCLTVDAATGSITAVSRGQAIVTATTHNNLTAGCLVIVDVAPADVKLNVSALTIGAKEVFNGLLPELVPPAGESTCSDAVTWSSSNSKVATVSADGTVTGVKNGSCTIAVSTPNGLKAECKVKVLKAPTSISISPKVGALKVGMKGQYKLSLSPAGSGGSISYSSSDTSVATIDGNGLVTAVAAGSAVITVSTYNGKTARAELVVSDSVGGDGGQSSKTAAEKLGYVISVAKTQLGKPYIYGSGYSADDNPRGFDCSGFVYWCFLHINVRLEDSAYRQGYDTTYPMISMNNLRPGDLVFFNTVSDSDKSDHSGLYLGNGQFIHASSSAGKVIISSMSTPGSYYYRNFSWGRRVLD